MNRIKFIESSHQYLTEDDRELISVSKLMDRFKRKKNWAIIAKRSAKKETDNGNPMTQQDMLDKWEKKGKLSREIGTLYHHIKEQELLAERNPIFYNVPCETKGCTHDSNFKYSIPINELSNNMVYPELMIYDLDYMICGQSDKVIVTNNTINIWDYKTDDEIKYKAFRSKWEDPEKFLPPLSHIEVANGNEYSIKMSIYMYLLWKANKGKLKPGELIIEHVHLERDSDNDNIPTLLDGKPVVKKIDKIHLPYRKREVIAMLETLKTK